MTLIAEGLSSLYEPSLRTLTVFMLVPEEENFDVVIKVSFWTELQNSLFKYVDIVCPVILMLSELREDKV